MAKHDKNWPTGETFDIDTSVPDKREDAIGKAKKLMSRSRRGDFPLRFAFDYLESASEKHPNSSVIWTMFGTACSLMHCDELGIDAFRKAFSITPNNPNTMMEYARLLKKTGRYDLAEDMLIRHVRYSKGYNKYNLSALGDLYQKAGEHTLSIQQSESFANDDFSLSCVCFAVAAKENPHDNYARARHDEIRDYLRGTGFSMQEEQERLLSHHEQRWRDMRTHEGEKKIQRNRTPFSEEPLLIQVLE